MTKLYRAVETVDGNKIAVLGDTPEGAEATAKVLAEAYRRTLDTMAKNVRGGKDGR